MTLCCRNRTRVWAAVLILGLPLTVSAQPKAEVSAVVPQTVSATGTATDEVSPDTARLTFGIEVRNPSTTQAVRVNERMTSKVVDALEKQGVEPKSILVAPYEMSFVPNTFIPALGTNQKVEFDIQQKGAYRVTTDITVTVRDLAGIPDVIQTALDAGVDRIDAIQYTTGSRAEVEQGLIPRAVEDAKSRARVLADNLGLILLGPLQISSLPSSSSQDKEVSMANIRAGNFDPPKLTVSVSVRVEFRATKVN